MRLLFSLICLLYINISFSQTQLSSEDWQNDLRFLQSEIHANYSHLFKKISATAFDKEVETLYNAIPNMESYAVNVAFSRLIALFKYGHTQIPFGTVAQRGVLPVNLYHFNDGVFIEGVTTAHKETLGAKVLKIEGIEIEQALEIVRPVVPAENDSYYKAYGLRFLTVPDVLYAQGILKKWSENVTLTLEKDSKVFDYTFPTIALNTVSKGATLTIPNTEWLSARDQSATPLYLKDLNSKYYYYEYVETSKTLYVRQSSVFDDPKEPLKEFYERLFAFIDSHTIDKFIYDVRLNGGGNNFNNLQLIKGLMARPKINTKGKFFFIIGRETFSAAQNLTYDIERYTEAILIGEPTAENINFYGDARAVVLPKSNIRVYLSYAWWQDAPQWANKDATVPHIAVDMSFNAFKTNADPVLETIFNYKDEGFILKPIEHLTALFLAGDYEKLKTDAFEIAKNPEYRYYDFEDEFGKAAGHLIQTGSYEGAAFIFKVLTEVYPESAGHYLNLGGALESAEQNEKAIEAYELLIERLPEHRLAGVAKDRIKSLKKK